MNVSQYAIITAIISLAVLGTIISPVFADDHDQTFQVDFTYNNSTNEGSYHLNFDDTPCMVSYGDLIYFNNEGPQTIIYFFPLLMNLNTYDDFASNEPGRFSEEVPCQGPTGFNFDTVKDTLSNTYSVNPQGFIIKHGFYTSSNHWDITPIKIQYFPNRSFNNVNPETVCNNSDQDVTAWILKDKQFKLYKDSCDTEHPIDEIRYNPITNISSSGENSGQQGDDGRDGPGGDNDNSGDSNDDDKKQTGGGCNDCTPPTLGLDNKMKRFVDNGFSYNGNVTDADYWHTDYPLITTEVGQNNTVELIVYENGGNHKLKWVQMALGIPEIGSPLNDAEVIIHLILFQSEIEDLLITDSLNLIESVNATASETTCRDGQTTNSCMKIIFDYTYREAPLHNIIAIDTMDSVRNSATHYFNDGVQVDGDSINVPPTDKIWKKSSWLNLTRTDRASDIWIDQNDIEYQKTQYGNYDRITPQPEWVCNDTPLDQIMNGGNRNNCHWRALIPHMWTH